HETDGDGIAALEVEVGSVLEIHAQVAEIGLGPSQAGDSAADIQGRKRRAQLDGRVLIKECFFNTECLAINPHLAHVAAQSFIDRPVDIIEIIETEIHAVLGNRAFVLGYLEARRPGGSGKYFGTFLDRKSTRLNSS